MNLVFEIKKVCFYQYERLLIESFHLELKEKFQIDFDQLNQLPFQVQVIYTDAEGNKALRVLTQLKETTENREVAELNACRAVIAENHIRSTATRMM